MTQRNLIAGTWREGDAWISVTHPFTGEELERVAVATTDQVDEAIAAASASMETLRALTVYERAQILRAIADGIDAKAPSLSQTLSAEAGKPIAQERAEVTRASETFRFAAEEVRSARGESLELDAALSGAGKWGVIRRFPVGPVSAITPFNFPLNLVVHKIAPAIAAGCPVVLKPADKTPLSALALAKIIEDAGWPKGALSVLNTTVERTTPLVEDPRMRLLSFTGSGAVGWDLKARAGQKKVLLELGGDAAVIVSEGGPRPKTEAWDAMIRRVALGAFAYGGQVCISVQRVLVQASLYEAFVEDLVDAVHTHVRVGPPEDERAVMSALIDDRAVEKVQRFVSDALARGAKRLTGGHREGEGSGRLFDPMVLVNVPQDALLACDEVFGPVVAVWPYETLDEAFERVNQSPYGLQAGIYTHDLREATRAFEELEVGAVLIGEIPTWRVDQMPYGGVKASGFGREGLKETLLEYTEPRLCVLPRS